jgi:thioredoxin reductase (NADPH)
VAGTGVAGTQARFRLFIENCHEHVEKIVRDLTGQSPPFDCRNKTNDAFAQQREQMPES